LEAAVKIHCWVNSKFIKKTAAFERLEVHWCFFRSSISFWKHDRFYLKNMNRKLKNGSELKSRLK
jgi:hypothetical protein